MGDRTSQYGERAGGMPKHPTDSFTSQNVTR